jgi:hypothetical protein
MQVFVAEQEVIYDFGWRTIFFVGAAVEFRGGLHR